MYENMTFENILNRCLARVSDSVDKREGSVIYDAIAPAAAELAILYVELGTLIDRAFPDTATDVDLTKKALERGVFRQAATCAVRKGYFEDSQGAGFDVKIGTRFSGGSINYAVTERIVQGLFKLTAETAGVVGNEYSGTLFPIDFVEGLATARLAEVLIPGEDEESDDSLRERYFKILKSQAFGGNIADYKNKVELIQGVGAAKIIPVWNGGGTVKIILLSSEWGVPSAELVTTVKNTIDPTEYQGKGIGFAPIGHIVTVVPATAAAINISFELTLSTGVTWIDVQQSVNDAVNSYFSELVRAWADSSGLVIRVSQIETRILNVAGVIDIAGTTINDGTANITLDSAAVPVLGVVTNGAS